MPKYHCSDCGRDFESSEKIVSCPFCLGFGKPEANCRCEHWRTNGGIVVNAISRVAEECPLHSHRILWRP